MGLMDSLRKATGLGLSAKEQPSQTPPYAADVVAKLGQDVSSIDVGSGAVVLCTPCGKAVEFQADLYATRRTAELRQEIEDEIAAVRSELAALEAAVDRLVSLAHTH